MTRQRLFKSALSSLFLVLFLVLPRTVSANSQTDILGDSTTSTTIQIPPTAEGPGLILPDSPFFFLDQIKQNVRLLFAFTPEKKAEVYTAIAGERMAELRIMLLRNNANGIKIDLNGISDNLNAASDQLAQAQLTGRDVKQLAVNINQDIKRQQDEIDFLSSQSNGGLKTMVTAVQDLIFRAKLKAEESMPEDKFQNEILDDLTRRASEQVRNASDSAVAIRNVLDELSKQAVNLASQSSQARQDAIKKAFAGNNIEMQRMQQEILNQEIKRNQQLLQQQNTALQQARDAVAQAQKAANAFQAAQNIVNQLRAQPAPTLPAQK